MSPTRPSRNFFATWPYAQRHGVTASVRCFDPVACKILAGHALAPCVAALKEKGAGSSPTPPTCARLSGKSRHEYLVAVKSARSARVPRIDDKPGAGNDIAIIDAIMIGRNDNGIVG